MRFIEEQNSAISKITSELFISDYAGAGKEAKLKNKGITHVLDLSCEDERKYCAMKYMSIKIQDTKTEKLVDYLPKAFEFIQSCITCGGKILIHCQVGQSRSVSFVIAWLMYSAHLDGNKANYAKSYDLVSRKRSIAAPNAGFVTALQDLERRLNDLLARNVQLALDFSEIKLSAKESLIL